MKLGDLLDALERPAALPREALDRDVSSIAYDSRNAAPGSLFVAVRGFHSDGHQFIPQAVKRGAIAVVAEQERGAAETSGAIVIIVPDSRRALALLAARFYGHPSKRLGLIGVTGTNGKTTTTYLVKSVIEAAGAAAGLIGTIDYRVGGKVYPAPNTTPESLDLQRLLSEMAGLGAAFCVMEVSSHALALNRTAGCTFAVAAFTNLTQDHLDYHGTMESYRDAKLLLFTGLSPDSRAVINVDDASAAAIIGATKAKVITTGFSARADVRPEGAVRYGIRGLAVPVATPIGELSIESPLVGRHNLSNILTAVGVGVALGFSGDAIEAGIRNMKAVPGRMENIALGQPFGVIVDYAHTDDALERLLEAIREIAAGRIITVFGCGGDRDRAKRPKMGRAALANSDVVIVSSDNPRTEDPLSIIREIETGMTAGKKIGAHKLQRAGAGSTQKQYAVIPDRREAIAAAIRMAGPGDIVVLAGKGHEDYQIIGETKVRFDERAVARDEIKKQISECGLRNAE